MSIIMPKFPFKVRNKAAGFVLTVIKDWEQNPTEFWVTNELDNNIIFKPYFEEINENYSEEELEEFYQRR